MAQLAIYLDNQTAREIKRTSRKLGMSRSEWVSKAIKKDLQERLPDNFFGVLGTWEDGRSPKKIFKDIRKRSDQSTRSRLR